MQRLISLISLLFPLILCQDLSIFISNISPCTFCNGSLTDPYLDLYRAFLESAGNHSSASSLIFLISPTPTPYYIFESQLTNTSPFANFKGKIIIQSLDSSREPTIVWATNRLTLNVNSFLMMNNLLIDGINVHVPTVSQCTSQNTSACCSQISILDPSNAKCYVRKHYSKFPVGAAAGLILLSANAVTQIQNISFFNFHAVLGYKSLISVAVSQPVSIVLQYLNFLNCFFQKGMLYYSATNLSVFANLTFAAQNLTVSQWNSLQIVMDPDESMFHGGIGGDYSSFFLGIENTISPLLVSNLVVSDSFIDRFFIQMMSTLIVQNGNFDRFTGTVGYCNYQAKLYINNSKFINNTAKIELFQGVWITDIIPSYIFIENSQFINLYGYFIRAQRSYVQVDNCQITNITYPYYYKDSGMIAWSDSLCVWVFKNVEITNIFNTANMIFSGHYQMLSMDLINVSVSDVNFTDSFIFVITYSGNTTLDNVLFQRINVTQSLIMGTAGQAINITIINSLFRDINGHSKVGAFLLVSSPNNQLIMKNLTVERLISGTYFQLTIPLQNIVYYYQDVTFRNITFDSGMMIILLAGQSFDCVNCTFENIVFTGNVYVNQLFYVNQARFTLTDCTFRNISVLHGEGQIHLIRDSKVVISNVTYNDIFIEGNGGLSFSSGSVINMEKLTVRNIAKGQEGFIKVTDCVNLAVSDSQFINVTAFKFALFYVNNIVALAFQNNVFNSIVAQFETSVIFISSNFGAFSVFIIKNNIFNDNKALLSVGGNIVINSCKSPVLLINNSFESGFSLAGSFVSATGISDLTIRNCTFNQSLATQQGGALSLKELMLTIINSSFIDCFVQNGQGGTIYIENANISISYSWISRTYVNSSTQSQGSFIYGLYTDFSVFYEIGFENITIMGFEEMLDLAFVQGGGQVLNVTVINCTFLYNIIGGNAINFEARTVDIKHVRMIQNDIDIGNLILLRSESVLIDDLEVVLNSIGNNGGIVRLNGGTEVNLSNFNVFLNTFSGDYIYSSNEAQKVTLSNFSLSNNQELQNMLNKQNFLTMEKGLSLNCSNITLEYSKNSLFYVDSVPTITIKDITGYSLQNKNQGLFVVLNNTNCSIENIKLNELSQSLSQITSSSLNLTNITIKFISSLSSLLTIIPNNVNSTVNISSLIISNSDQGLSFQSPYLTISSLTFYTLTNPSPLTPVLSFTSPAQLSLSNTMISGAPAQALSIQTPLNQKSSLIISNLSVISCGDPSLISTIQVTGSVDLNLTNPNFTKLSSKSGLLIESQDPQSTFELNNPTFQSNSNVSNPDLSLIIPNKTFYTNFIASHSALLSSHQITMTSYVNTIRIYPQGSQQEIVDNSRIEIYSGDKLNFIFQAFDHLNQSSQSSDRWNASLTQKNTSYTLRNYQAIFMGSSAFISDLQILIPFGLQSSNLSIPMLASVYDSQGSLISTTSFFFSIKACNMGRVIKADQCLLCGTDFFSLDPTPTNETQCQSCPNNAGCRNGIDIIPNQGFWNLDPLTPTIVKCEASEACNLQKLSDCQEGYQGFVCSDCSENYGKALNRNCRTCDSSKDTYIVSHAIRSIIKWFVLAWFSVYQYRLLSGINAGGEKQDAWQLNYDIFGIFGFHMTVFACIVIFQEGDYDVVGFGEFQSIFAFLENNLYLIYCVFPYTREFKLPPVIFCYLLFICLVEIGLAVFFVLIEKYLLKRTQKIDLLGLASLVFFNNFVNFCYYIVGLIFYLPISNEQSVSVFFKELEFPSSTFYVMVFVEAFIIIFLMALCLYVLNRIYRKLSILQFMGCDYDIIRRDFLFMDYSCLFFMILLGHYSMVSAEFAKFARNVLMIYTGFIISFRIQKQLLSIAVGIKIFSCVVLVISLYQQPIAIIFLNSLFMGGILGLLVYRWVINK